MKGNQPFWKGNRKNPMANNVFVMKMVCQFYTVPVKFFKTTDSHTVLLEADTDFKSVSSSGKAQKTSEEISISLNKEQAY